MPRDLTIAVLPTRQACDSLFSEETWAELESLGAVVRNETEHGALSDEDTIALTRDADVCITSWGSPQLNEAVISASPRLSLVCHAAGTVKPFVSDALWDRGIKVTSASAAIAVEVATSTLSWIIVGVKRAHWGALSAREGGWRDGMPYPPSDVIGSTIGLIGASHVGRNVVGLLKPFDAKVLMYDPYLNDDAAAELGVEKVELDDLMHRSDVVAIHAPKTDETRHMINATNLRCMKDGATLINNARGAIIDEDALVAELQTGRIWAILDVTEPEPPAEAHPFRSLPNVILTPHMAGTVARGRQLLGKYVKDEVKLFAEGRPQKHAVTREQLSHVG